MKQTRFIVTAVAVTAMLLQAQQPVGAAGSEPTWGMTGTRVAIGANADADVAVFPDGSVRLYYQVIGRERNVVSHVSTDNGATWTREPGNRISNAAFPSLLQMPDKSWRMYIQTNIGMTTGIAYATSADGVTWQAPTSLVLTIGGEPYAIDTVGGHSILRLKDGTYLMAYIGTAGQAGSLFWATSPDGIAWTKKGFVIDARDEIALHHVGIDGAELVQWDDNTVKLYFRGFTGIEVVEYVNGAFTSPSQTVIRQVNGKYAIVPGDPTLGYYGGRWHLFHGMGPKSDSSQPDEGIYEASYVAPVQPAPVATATPTASPKPSSAAPAPKKLITCTKGKLTKKVATAKCPAGWKPKK